MLALPRDLVQFWGPKLSKLFSNASAHSLTLI